MNAIDGETDPKAEPKAEAAPRALNDTQERFASALADGMSVADAAKAAGYSTASSRPAALAKDPRVVARVRALILDEEWGGSGDLRPVINALRRLFDEGGALSSAAALKERREILAEAARLKALLPPPRSQYVYEPPLTNQQWLEKFAPKTPAG